MAERVLRRAQEAEIAAAQPADDARGRTVDDAARRLLQPNDCIVWFMSVDISPKRPPDKSCTAIAPTGSGSPEGIPTRSRS
jgi:hypothetical protein